MTNSKLRKGYLHRFQTKKARHLRHKTNYTHRRNLIRPNLKNYGAVKSRLVVRKTNRQIICQIVKAYPEGDRVCFAASSEELRAYGLEVGLTNYTAAYATGLLVGRKASVGLGYDDAIGEVSNDKASNDKSNDKASNDKSNDKASKNDNDDSDSEVRRPYQVFLDIGLSRSTRGNKLFAAMKGASDAGLKIPHGLKIFPGYDTATKSFDAGALKERIYGKAVKDYMMLLRESDRQKYETLFAEYIRKGVGPEDLEALYEGVFERIRGCREFGKKERKCYAENKKFKVVKMSGEEKRRRIAERVN